MNTKHTTRLIATLQPLADKPVEMNWSAEVFLTFAYVANAEVRHPRWQDTPMQSILQRVVDSMPHIDSVRGTFDAQGVYFIALIADDIIGMDDAPIGLETGLELLTEYVYNLPDFVNLDRPVDGLSGEEW